MEVPQPGPLEEQNKRSPVVAFLYGLFFVGVALVLTCGIGTYFFLSSERGQVFLDNARQAAALAEQGLNAPGTPELMELGCETAIVTSLGEMVGVIDAFSGEDDASSMSEEDAATHLVLCSVRGFSDAPTCEEIAATYGTAVDAPDHFLVTVQGGGSDGECEGIYSPSGQRLGGLEEFD